LLNKRRKSSLEKKEGLTGSKSQEHYRSCCAKEREKKISKDLNTNIPICVTVLPLT